VASCWKFARLNAFPWPELLASRAISDSAGPIGARLVGLAQNLLDTRALCTRLTAVSRQNASLIWRKRLGDFSLLASPATIAVVGAPARSPLEAQSYVICMQSTLAARVVAAALDLPVPLLMRTGATPTPALCGAAAAVVADLLRHAAPDAVRVHAAHAVNDLAGYMGVASLLELDHTYVASAFAVLIGPEVFECVILVPRCAIAEAAHYTYIGTSLPSLALHVPVVGGTFWIERTELTALAVGDVVRAKLPCALDHENRVRLVGTAWLCPGLAEDGYRITLDGPRCSIASTQLEPLPWDTLPRQIVALEGTSTMANSDPAPRMESSEVTTSSPPNTDADPAVAANWLQHSSVVLRIEVGSVEMLAAEWTALRSGDVINVGTPPEAGVCLRASGKLVARGELVVVAGTVGVRITERIE
jgi:flagellar motor switch/type III secretory pathway protein FliN